MVNSHSFPLRAERFNKRHSYAEYVFVIWEVVSIHPRGDLIKKHFFTSEGSSTESFRKSWNFFYSKLAATRVVEANVDINYLTNVNVWVATFLTFYFVCGSQKSAQHWKFFSKIKGTKRYWPQVRRQFADKNKREIPQLLIINELRDFGVPRTELPILLPDIFNYILIILIINELYLCSFQLSFF